MRFRWRSWMTVVVGIVAVLMFIGSVIGFALWFDQAHCRDRAAAKGWTYSWSPTAGCVYNPPEDLE